MAKLTPDATRTEHGLVINEKIIPWGAVWPKDSGAYKKGAQYKADRLLSGGTGKVKGTALGALIIGVLGNALNLLNVSSYYQMMIQGAVILTAVLMDRGKNKR